MSPRDAIRDASAVLNRAGFVSINPPTGFLDHVAPALWAAGPKLRAAEIRPDDRERTEALAVALMRASRAFVAFAPCLRAMGDPEGAAEFSAVASALHESARGLMAPRHA